MMFSVDQVVTGFFRQAGKRRNLFEGKMQAIIIWMLVSVHYVQAPTLFNENERKNSVIGLARRQLFEF